RVVVLVVVAGETDLVEQVAVDRGQAGGQVDVALELRAQGLGIGVDLGGVAGRVEVGVFIAGNQQCRVEQRQFVVAELGERVPVGKRAGGLHGSNVAPPVA